MHVGGLYTQPPAAVNPNYPVTAAALPTVPEKRYPLLTPALRAFTEAEALHPGTEFFLN